MNKILFMALLAIVGAGRWPARSYAAVEPSAARYQCPMHPQIVSDKPGKCPICHMDLVLVQAKASSPKAAQGRAAFELSPERQQLIGLRVAKAQVRSLSKTLRLAGRVSGGAVLAQLLEMDAGTLKAGMKAVLVGPGSQEAKAVVGGVEGGLDSVTRSFGVLISPLESRPWMKNGVYCEARVEVSLGRGLAVPEEALIDTGERKTVFVRKESLLEPRDVTLGQTGGGFIRVLSGLSEGEEVVVSGNFLVDSEARFRSASEAQP